MKHRLKMSVLSAIWLLSGLWLFLAAAACGADTVRVAALKFGTVNWELDVIQHHGLDRNNRFNMETLELASKNATAVALQGGAADIIVTDWFWVSRQRAAGKNYVFVPYSMAVGKLMASPSAGIDSLSDLRGQKLGIAGGPADKSWLLLRAYSRKILGSDLRSQVEPVFVSPPLLNQLLLRGELPAAVNFWHYTARLEAAGMKPVIRIMDVLPELKINGRVPLLGWVFHEDWAAAYPDAAHGFLTASYAAKRILMESDAEWNRIRPLTKAESDTVFDALKSTYREGVPHAFGSIERQNSARLFSILAETSGTQLVGESKHLSDGTFWDEFSISDQFK